MPPNSYTLQSHGYILLGILLNHAPTSAAQAEMVNEYHKICRQVQEDWETERDVALQIEQSLVIILLQGLRHDAWPWSGLDTCADPECAADHSVTVRPK